ncbi:hypothetical protein H5T87_09865 [bacterium]|nr:hypothetical protein [bacterium]
MKKLFIIPFVLLGLCLAQEKLSILFLQTSLEDRTVARKLQEAGFEFDWRWDFPDESYIKQFNVVVLLRGGAYLGEKERETILNFVKEGGGLFISLWKGEHLEDWNSQFLLLDAINARLRPETIRDPQNQRDGNTPWGIIFAHTKNIIPSPVSMGVQGIWYPISEYAGGCSATLPFDVGGEWQIIVRGEQTSKSEPWTSAARGLPPERITSDGIPAPPIFAIRSYGEGRIALCGINASYHLWGGYATALRGIVMESGLDSQPSDFLHLLLNTFHWLAEPSIKSGKFGGAKTPTQLLEEPKLPQIPPWDWKNPRFPPPPRVFKGIVGVQTELSGGKGKVADYVREARSLGLDFIVFLEDFANLSKEDWEKLVKECEAVGEKDFLAVPGFRFQDGYGNNYFSAGFRTRYPDDYLLDEKRRFAITHPDLKYPGQVGMVLLDWMHNLNRMNLTIGSWLHSLNPCPYYEFRAYDAVAIFTQDFRQNKPKLLDELIYGYAHLENRGESLWPFAICFIDEPSQLEKAVKEGFLNYFEGESLSDLKEQFSTWHASMPPYCHLRYVSNGPRIVEWRFIGPRDYENYDWFDWTHWRWRLRLVVESDKGLRDIKVYDGEDLIRHFYPNGKKHFVWEEDFNHGQQHNLFVIAEDIQGKRAISMELFDRPQPLLEEFMCGDRMNQLSYSMQRREDGTGAQSGFVWGMTPNKGPWNGAGQIAPSSTYKPDNRLGGMIPGFDGAPGGDPQLYVIPTIKSDKGEEDLSQGRIWTDRLLDSADLMMGYGKSDGFYPKGVPAFNVWSTLAPTTPSKLIEATIRRTYFNLRPGLFSPIVVELEIGFKQNLKIESLKLGQFERAGAKSWFIRTKDGEILSSQRSPQAIADWKKIELGKDGYIAFCGSPLGSVAIFNLGSSPLDVYAQKDSGSWEIRFPLEGKELIKGSKVNARLLVVGTPFTVEPDERWIEKVREAMGLAGKPGYKVKVEKGTIKESRYILRANGEGECFVAKFEQADLPLALPIVVEGLNERWSTFLLERNNGLARPIGQLKDSAYATIDLREGEKDIFIGHPVICDDREVFINVVQTGEKEFSIYIHNPTATTKKVLLRSSPFWTLGKLSPRRVTLQPGEVKLLKFY